MNKYNITKQFLIQEYNKKRESIQEITRIVGCSSNTIHYWLKKFGIYIRTRSEAGKLKKSKYNITKEFLIKEYSKKEKNLNQIAKEVGCSVKVIWNRLKKYGIRTRTYSEVRKGIKNGNYIDGRTNKKYSCIEPNCNNKINYNAWKYRSGRCHPCAIKKMWQDEIFKNKMKKKRIKKWQDKKYRDKVTKAILKGLQLKPNKPEKQLNRLLNEMLPSGYRYVGDGKVILGGFCPDFININGQKKIIELFGCYWHKCSKCNFGNGRKIDKKRLVVYKKYGYKTLIVWQHELKDVDKLRIKILNF